MTTTQKQAVQEMRKQDMSYSAIASALGLSTNTIKSFCRRENIDTHRCSNDEKHDLCKNCSEPLKHLLGSKKKVFCSNKCRYTWWNRHRVYLGYKGTHRLTCFYCGNEFLSKNKKRKYCGRICYVHSQSGEGLP